MKQLVRDENITGNELFCGFLKHNQTAKTVFTRGKCAIFTKKIVFSRFTS